MDYWEAARTAGSVSAGAVVIYVYVVVLLRVSGNRTLASLRAFDFIVTVAMGTVVGSAAIQASFDGTWRAVVAVTVLVLLQVTVAWSSSRFNRVGKLVTNKPRIVLYDGAYLPDEMRAARVTREEIEAKIRARGHSSIDEVWAVVLEANGDMSVLPKAAAAEERSALRNVPAPARN